MDKNTINNTKKRTAIFLVVFIIGILAGICGYMNAKITTFQECEKAGWLVRSITVYDYIDECGSIEKECLLWSGKIFVKEKTQELTEDQKRAVQIATLPLSYPTTIVEVKKLECYGCFSVTLQRDDNQRQFIIMLNDWKYNQTIHSK